MNVVSAWTLAGTLTSKHELSDSDWVCDQCIHNGLRELEVRSEHIQGVIDKLDTVGAVYLYTRAISPCISVHVQQKLNAYKKYLFRKLNVLGYKVFNVGQTRKLVYDEHKLSPELAPIVMDGLARRHDNKEWQPRPYQEFSQETDSIFSNIS